jgi:hypothetical protein
MLGGSCSPCCSTSFIACAFTGWSKTQSCWNMLNAKGTKTPISESWERFFKFDIVADKALDLIQNTRDDFGSTDIGNPNQYLMSQIATRALYGNVFARSHGGKLQIKAQLTRRVIAGPQFFPTITTEIIYEKDSLSLWQSMADGDKIRFDSSEVISVIVTDPIFSQDGLPNWDAPAIDEIGSIVFVVVDMPPDMRGEYVVRLDVDVPKIETLYAGTPLVVSAEGFSGKSFQLATDSLVEEGQSCNQWQLSLWSLAKRNSSGRVGMAKYDSLYLTAKGTGSALFGGCPFRPSFLCQINPWAWLALSSNGVFSEYLPELRFTESINRRTRELIGLPPATVSDGYMFHGMASKESAAAFPIHGAFSPWNLHGGVMVSVTKVS